MNKLFVLLSLACFGFVACGAFSAEQAATVQQVLVDLRDAGKITPEQYEALLQSFHQSWDGWTDIAIVVGGSVLASLTGMQIVRGPTATKAERLQRLATKKGLVAPVPSDEVPAS